MRKDNQEAEIIQGSFKTDLFSDGEYDGKEVFLKYKYH
ncbi:unnamed protein product [Commensalibacter papalotli (ex Botero et al. 2024)]|uniref:Transposase n=1 Tax=Commensalibacter papalotli (ex Botero et al. 2024) TaxID=2972766 RepID=A0ABN8W6S5_9PROT|nr:unnamed protein product [Commensalibacter papalotli (ex Botero et al. 2024)]CAI3929716.1 unnamed protein product [Commensalibacter papalotli (ex Botero et al. 2024)]